MRGRRAERQALPDIQFEVRLKKMPEREEEARGPAFAHAAANHDLAQQRLHDNPAGDIAVSP